MMGSWTEAVFDTLANAIGVPVPIVFSVFLILLGAFFALQLLIAIMSSKFAQLSLEQVGGLARQGHKPGQQRDAMSWWEGGSRRDRLDEFDRHATRARPDCFNTC